MHGLPSEKAAVVATVDPQTVANTEKLSDAVDMQKWGEILAIFLTGDMASETIDFKLMECATSGGTYTDITGKAITQRAAHASNNDNLQFIVNLKAEELGAGKRYVKARAITGGATGGPASVVVLGLRPKFNPASDDDLASVAEIIG
jgi:hypothetical protein